MKKLTLLPVAILLLSACQHESDGKPVAVAVPAPAKQASPASPTRPTLRTTKRVAIASTSELGWVGAKVTGDHHGGFRAFEGHATLGSDGRLDALSLEVDTTSIHSDHDKLTAHLKSVDFFEVERFPKASFASTSIRPGLDAAFQEDPKIQGATHTIEGTLTIREVSQRIKFPATLSKTSGALTARATFNIDRTAFGIRYKGRADDLIRDLVLLKLKLDIPTSPRS